MDIIETIIEGNTQFAHHGFAPGLPLLPRSKALLLGCVDPRVDPAHILGITLGEVAVLRNIGGRVTANVLAEVALLGRLGRMISGGASAPSELIVLQHTDCGITRLQDPPDALANYFHIDAASLSGKHVTDPYAAVAGDLALLRSIPQIVAAFRVTGLVYDVETGRIDVVSGPDPAASL